MPRGRIWTAEEDERIMEALAPRERRTETLARLAKELGRTERAVEVRKTRLQSQSVELPRDG